jgi:hypothetical protein
VGHSRTGVRAYLLVVAVTCLAHFIFSCVLLPAEAQTGSSCSGDSTCNAGARSTGCLAVPVAGSSCSAVCFSERVAPHTPFRFAVDGMGGGGYVQCPFPRGNTYVTSAWL